MELLVASSSSPDRGSGVNGACRNLCEGLRALGHGVHFYSPSPSDHTWLKELGIAHVPCSQNDEPARAVLAVIEYVRSHSIDGAINNDNPFLQSAAPGLRCPLVVIGHMPRSSVATLACFNQDWVDYVVAISSDMQQMYITKYGIPVTKCPVVFNGLTDPAPAWTADSTSTNIHLDVAFAGGDSHNKGADRLINALRSHPNLWARVHLHWFGNVADGMRRQVPPEIKCTFYGRVSREQFHQTLQRCHVFILASRSEGCPMALLEAMSFGLVPIVSADEGAMRWLVTSGQNGFVCSSRQWAKQASECVDTLTRSPEYRVRLRSAARQTYLSELQSAHSAEQILALVKTPTVNRESLPTQFPALKWHRPHLPGTNRAPIFDRLCIRFGYLRKSGRVERS